MSLIGAVASMKTLVWHQHSPLPMRLATSKILSHNLYGYIDPQQNIHSNQRTTHKLPDNVWPVVRVKYHILVWLQMKKIKVYHIFWELTGSVERKVKEIFF